MLNFIIFIQGLIILILCIYILILHNKHGEIVITQDKDGKKLFSLELDKNPEEIERMRYILFKVVDSQLKQ